MIAFRTSIVETKKAGWMWSVSAHRGHKERWFTVAKGFSDNCADAARACSDAIVAWITPRTPKEPVPGRWACSQCGAPCDGEDPAVEECECGGDYRQALDRHST